MNSIFPKCPKLSLIGAGPGDLDLITVKAVYALEAADVVFYDALVYPEILTLSLIQLFPCRRLLTRVFRCFS